MSRFLSQEWVDELDAALSNPALPPPAEGAGLAAGKETFTVVEDVRGAPEGDLRLVLRAEEGRLSLSRQRLGSGGTGDGQPEDGDRDPSGDVTVTVAYEDAEALSTGALTPAEALTAGRIRVRGDLSVLVRAQSILDAARGRVAEGAREASTDPG